MWIERDLLLFLNKTSQKKRLPIKILRGPRQVGKTSLLHKMGTHRLLPFDDLSIRRLAEENPRFFFEEFRGPLLLDEATHVPSLFLEIKRRVDASRRDVLQGKPGEEIDIWITGSNQTLLRKSVQESLAGRAQYFSLHTLSLHEQKKAFGALSLEKALLRGGWPELALHPDLDSITFLNSFLTTFVEKDIVLAAGIEKKAAFTKAIALLAGRVGQLINYADIAKHVMADTSSLQSWVLLLEENGIVKTLSPYASNHNQRLVKTPKLYWEDVALATRLQGWSSYEPLACSPYFGLLLENLAYNEICRFFTNQGREPEVWFVRSKDQAEVDFLVHIANHRYLAIEVKNSPVDFSASQLRLLDSLQLPIVERWVVSFSKTVSFPHSRGVLHEEIFDALTRITQE